MENTDSTTPTHSARRFLGDALGAWAPSPTTQQWNDSRRPDGSAAAAGAATAAAGTLHTGPLPHSISKLHLVDSSSPGVGSPFAIRSYPGAENHQPAAADGRDAGSGTAVQEALAADYRAQLKQYAAQLASKENEVAQLRATTTTLKAQLGCATGGLADAGEQAARTSAQVAQLENHILNLEAQLRQREQEAEAATRQRAAAEQDAATARAQAAAVQKGVTAKAQDWEGSRRHYKEQLELKDLQIARLEEVVQKQTAEAERRAREWAQREVDLSQAHAQNKDSAASLRSQMSVLQDQLEAALRRAKAAETGTADLRRQKGQMLADMKMLEDLLADSDSERRELHEKYVVLGERMETLVRETAAVKEQAAMESEAARLAVQEAVRDAESAVNERASLQKRIKELQEALETEGAGRAKLAERVQRKLAAAEQEVTFLRAELESKAKQLRGLQADLKATHADADSKLDACEAQMQSHKSRIAILSRELEQEKKRAVQVREEADALWGERLKVESQQQALKYERRIQELEMQYAHSHLGMSARSVVAPAASASVAAAPITLLDYIPRSEHVRVLESRLAAKESDMTVEMNSRINQTEREWQWKVDGKEQEINSLNARVRQLEDDLHTDRQRSSSHSHKLGDENKRLAAQCVELQRELDAAQKELTRLKESLKDARLANAGMDNDQMTASRQVARLKHALDESNGALREAQAALDKDHKHCEAVERELEQHKARMEDAYRKVARLEGEVAELNAALEQKQEVVSALQAENAGWSAKLMAHREWHDGEVENVRRALKQESEGKLAPLEARCSALAAELREARARHEERLGEMEAQHAVQVAQLERQLAAAERCASELKELSVSLTGVKQDDLEMMKGHVHDLQLKLKEAHQQRARERKEHQAQLAALEAGIKAKLGALKAQHKLFRAQVQGEVAQSCSDCLHDFEAGLAAVRQQLADSSAAAAQAQEAAAAHVARLRESLAKVLSALGEQCGTALPAGLDVALADAAAASDAAATGRIVQQVAEGLRQHVGASAAAAADAVLAPLEQCLFAGGEEDEELLDGSSEDERPRARGTARSSRAVQQRQRAQQRPKSARSPSAGGRVSPRKRQLAGAGLVLGGAQASGQQALPVLGEGVQSRLAVLVSRCHELLADLAANEEEIGQLKQQVASYDEAFAKAKAESVQAAEKAHDAAVAPLRQEVQRLQDRVRELQQQYSTEVAAIEASSKQQLSEAQAQAQRSLDQTVAQSRQLAADLAAERQRGDGAAAELARTQDELAKHTQRAASKIELQERELGLLKDRIREMERRDQQTEEEMRVLKQRQREVAAAGGGLGRLGS